MKAWLWRHRIACMFILFLALRMVFLFRYPPFNDESIHVRYGQIMIQNPPLLWASIRYYSKQPLAFWIFGLGAELFGGPFTGARFAALFINSVSFFFLRDWLKRITGEKNAAVSLLLFAVCPLFIFFQTLAIMDGFLMTPTIIVLWGLERYRERRRFMYLIIMALALSFALWIKSNAILLVLLTAGTLIYENKNKFRWALPVAVLMFMVLAFISPLLLRPDFGLIITGPQEYTYTMRELFTFPFITWTKNSLSILLGFLLYVSPLYLPALLVSRATLPKRHFMLLLTWSVTLIGASILLGKVFSVRYAVMGVIPLLPLVATGLLYPVRYRTVLLITGIGAPLVLSILLIVYSPWFFALFPPHTPMATERNYGYYATSGYAGIQAVNYIRSRLIGISPVVLTVPDSPGNPADMILASFYNAPGVATVILNSPADLKGYASYIARYPAYVIAGKAALPPFLIPYLSPIISFPTPDKGDSVGIYRLHMQK